MTRRGSDDRWAEWLLERRFGGDAEFRDEVLAELADVRDRVLDRTSVTLGDVLLDVGCGDGLIAFGALERGAGTVIFSDVSPELLDRCRAIAVELGVEAKCRFLRAPAEQLVGVADASVDIVTTRSVLIYVADKERAFREFFRVLRPGGRLSLFEPINRLSNSSMPTRSLPFRISSTASRSSFAGSSPPSLTRC